MTIKYTPFKKRSVDTQYKDGLATLKKFGKVSYSQMEENERAYMGLQFRFDLKNGFPIITERDVVSGDYSIFSQAIGELCGFLNGARTHDELVQFGCRWWKKFTSEEKCKKRGLEIGDLGPGSYRPAWTAFPTLNGGSFNQITHVIQQINELPHLKTHTVSPWIPYYTGRGRGKIQKVVFAPCHGWFDIFVNVYTKEMTLVHNQRSADYLVGLVANIIQYAALLLMIAHVTGYVPHELVYQIRSAQYYTPRQDEFVENILNAKTYPFPTVGVDGGIKTITEFRPNHFTVSDYSYSLNRMVIPTPV